MRRTSLHAGTRLAAVAALLLTLSACGGGDDETDASADPSTAGSEAPSDDSGGSPERPVIDEVELGERLDIMAGHGEPTGDRVVQECLVAAAIDTGITPAGQQAVIDMAGDDFETVAFELFEDDAFASDATLLISTYMMAETDACLAGTDQPGGAESSTEGFTPPPLPELPSDDDTGDGDQDAGGDPDGEVDGMGAPEPDLTPTIDINENTEITNATQLTEGLVVMFQSFAATPEQAQSYEDAGSCLSRAVLDAGFSQETLRFIAGGAQITVGSVSDHLSPEDAFIWESPDFTSAMVSCTDSAATTGTTA